MNTLKLLRWLGLIEGISFLLLLFVAMPLKYLYQAPEAVRVVGMVHGFLFVALVGVLVHVSVERSWSVIKGAQIFGAAIVPFGFVFIDRLLKREMASLSEQSSAS